MIYSERPRYVRSGESATIVSFCSCYDEISIYMSAQPSSISREYLKIFWELLWNSVKFVLSATVLFGTSTSWYCYSSNLNSSVWSNNTVLLFLAVISSLSFPLCLLWLIVQSRLIWPSHLWRIWIMSLSRHINLILFVLSSFGRLASGQ